MSLCCEIGSRERLPLRIFVDGEPSPVPLRRLSHENLPRKAHKDLVTAEVCTL
ncbi:Hypothetical protein FKW44_009349 [Caligus rogercresseyi]|uniref:Uncharacterized protein n=1 Tax=Caligus rogercresseyi TaxID=217165 RepID=A0A7T8HG71_CALRO|nr:Hypothetical protein FKW44_009349 [Caligus rogercresseyi]